MQGSGVKRRQKSQNKPQNGEKEEEEAASSRFRPDVKLSVGLMCVTASVFMTWLHVQQNAKLAEMTEKYEYLYEKSRSVQELEEKMSEVSQKLQASSSSSSSSTLKHSITSIHNTSDTLQAEQEASSLRIHTLSEHMRSVTEAWQSRQVTVSVELNELKTRTRAAHTHVTEHINDAEALLRELNERLQEVQDGTRRNARVLDRTEEEDAGWVRDHLDWNERRVSRLQEQLQRLSEQGQELHQRLESSAPHTQRWQDTHLPTAEEAVRSMLRVRAQVSATHRRLEELQLQVRSAEELMKRTRDVGPAGQEDNSLRDSQELNGALTGE